MQWLKTSVSGRVASKCQHTYRTRALMMKVLSLLSARFVKYHTDLRTLPATLSGFIVSFYVYSAPSVYLRWPEKPTSVAPSCSSIPLFPHVCLAPAFLSQVCRTPKKYKVCASWALPLTPEQNLLLFSSRFRGSFFQGEKWSASQLARPVTQVSAAFTLG